MSNTEILDVFQLYQHYPTGICNVIETDTTPKGVDRKEYLTRTMQSGVSDEAQKHFYSLYALFVKQDGRWVAVWQMINGWYPVANLYFI